MAQCNSPLPRSCGMLPCSSAHPTSRLGTLESGGRRRHSMWHAVDQNRVHVATKHEGERIVEEAANIRIIATLALRHPEAKSVGGALEVVGTVGAVRDHRDVCEGEVGEITAIELAGITAAWSHIEERACGKRVGNLDVLEGDVARIEGPPQVEDTTAPVWILLSEVQHVAVCECLADLITKPGRCVSKDERHTVRVVPRGDASPHVRGAFAADIHGIVV
eukprot:5891782-Prymnesium_polylepis.1